MKEVHSVLNTVMIGVSHITDSIIISKHMVCTQNTIRKKYSECFKAGISVAEKVGVSMTRLKMSVAQ